MVIISARNLHEGGAQHDANQGVKGEGDGAGLEVSGNQCFVSEPRKPFMSPFESGVSFLRRSPPGGLILNIDSEVNHGYNNGRITQGHASELAFNGRKLLVPPPWLGGGAADRKKGGQLGFASSPKQAMIPRRVMLE